MNDINDDLLVRKFFEDNRISVTDNGFSQRVMQRLPRRARRLNRIWTVICAVAGLIFVFTSDWLTPLKACIAGLTAHIPMSHTPLTYILIMTAVMTLAAFFTGCKLANDP